MFFDEAQQLGVWPDGLELQQELRVRLRDPERQSTFLFAGSAQSMMETLFAADGLLEWDGQQFELSPVTDEPWREGLRRAFRELGTEITLRATEAILDGADGRPMRMMLIANRAHLLATLVEADTIDHELAAQAVREAQRDRLWSEGE